VTNTFSTIGLHANQVIYHDEKLYVVNSGAHELQIINANTGITDSRVNLDNSSNPMNVIEHNGFLYVTGLYSNRLYKINISDTSAITALDIGIGPDGIAIIEDRMYITLTGFTGLDYVQGQVCVVDLNTFTIITKIDVPTNPQDIVVDSRGFLHVVCTGDYFNERGVAVIIDPTTHEIVHRIDFDVFLLNIQIGLNDTVFMSDAFIGGLHTYCAITFQKGEILYPGAHSLMYDDDYLYVLEANFAGNSRLYVYLHDNTLVQQVTLAAGSISMTKRSTTVSESDVVIPTGFEVTIYPNPFTHEVKLSINNSQTSRHTPADYYFQIFNIRGQKVANLTGNNLVWNGKDRNGRDLPSGIYFIKVSNGEYNSTRKLLKIR
jgi:hypothetical protein